MIDRIGGWGLVDFIIQVLHENKDKKPLFSSGSLQRCGTLFHISEEGYRSAS
jgi:hypothetical protein